jgi:hypothetical protein
MNRLTPDDRAAFRELTERSWVQSPEERSPRVVEDTPEARERYCRWATDAARFFKGQKPVRFTGSHWKL